MTVRMRLVALMMIATVVVIGVCAEATAAIGRLNTAERQVVRLINAQRQKHGVAPLRISRALCRAAERHSVDMRRRQYFGHSSLNGASIAARAIAGGYRRGGCSAWRVGEVIGWGSGPHRTPAAQVRAWMRSGTHRAVLLSPVWRHVGVGRVTGSFRGIARTAICTVDFGLRR
ncbi:MAG: CAP domain-containing protein [Actinobacteria bacterium]|nr:CAP domain-containing protein [Actinomycetota bacterium]